MRRSSQDDHITRNNLVLELDHLAEEGSKSIWPHILVL